MTISGIMLPVETMERVWSSRMAALKQQLDDTETLLREACATVQGFRLAMEEAQRQLLLLTTKKETARG